MKTKFFSSDLKEAVEDIQSKLISEQVLNIYNLSDKAYLIKFNTTATLPSDTSNLLPAGEVSKNSKQYIIIESGSRIHLTSYVSTDRPDFPSPFAMKLRKYIRSKRLESITQLNFDRVVDLKFSSGSSTNHLIIELYSSGNIVLTDENYQVLALLRSHQFSSDLPLKVNEIYPIILATNIDKKQEVFFPTKEALIKFLSDKQAKNDERNAKTEAKNAKNEVKNQKLDEKKKKINFRSALLDSDSPVAYLGPELLEHILLDTSNFTANMKIPNVLSLLTNEDFSAESGDLSIGEANFQSLYNAFQSFLASFLQKQGEKVGDRGFIFYQNVTNAGAPEVSNAVESAVSAPATETRHFTHFSPILLNQFKSQPYQSYPTFSQALDEYFYTIELQKHKLEIQKKEESTMKKLNNVIQDQQALVLNIRKKILYLKKCIKCIEFFQEDVKNVCLVIRSMVANHLTWDLIEETIELEQVNGNPVASLITGLKLQEKKITIGLPLDEDIEFDFDEGEEELIQQETRQMQSIKKSAQEASKEQKNKHKKISDDQSQSESESESDLSEDESETSEEMINIDIFFEMNPHENMNELFSETKTLRNKLIKTEEANKKIIANLKEKTEKSLLKINENLNKKSLTLVKNKKNFWYEKFFWFFSSDNFLILCGKNEEQNEMLVKKYLRPWDLYLHADINGASSCIIRAKKRSFAEKSDKTSDFVSCGITESGAEYFVSPLALLEAGAMSVCRSRAWSSSIHASSYWVRAHQVSKTPPSGEYLVTGSFMITGKKNYLTPAPLEVGVGLLYRLSDLCAWKKFVEKKLNFKSDKYVEDASPEAQEDEDEAEAAAEAEAEAEEREQAQRQEKYLKYMDDLQGREEDVIIYTNNSYQKHRTQRMEVLSECEPSPHCSPHASEDERESALKDEEDVEEEEEEEYLQFKSQTKASPMPSKNAPQKPSKKKTLPKKKARRYAEQDDDDKEIAMMALGHASKQGQKLSDLQKLEENQKKLKEISQKKEKSGISKMLKMKNSEKFEKLETSLSKKSFELFSPLFNDQLDINDFEISNIEIISKFSEENLEYIVQTFLNSLKENDKIKNKTSFFKAIMRRVHKEQEESGKPGQSSKPRNVSASGAGEAANQKPITPAIDPLDLYEEDDDDDEEQEQDSSHNIDKEFFSFLYSLSASQASSPGGTISLSESLTEDDKNFKKFFSLLNESDKFVCNPSPDDELLHALPVVAPYSSLIRYHSRIKLTPGNLKKSKASQQVLQLFKESTSKKAKESKKHQDEMVAQHVKNLQEADLTPNILGDVKISMPGMQNTIRKKKQRGQKK